MGIPEKPKTRRTRAFLDNQNEFCPRYKKEGKRQKHECQHCGANKRKLFRKCWILASLTDNYGHLLLDSKTGGKLEMLLQKPNEINGKFRIALNFQK